LDKCTAVIEHHVTVLKSWDKHMQEARHIPQPSRACHTFG
jgi:hypothetical protein